MHSSVDTTFDSSYTCMGQIALFGLANRDFNESSIEGFQACFHEIIHAFIKIE